MRRCHVRVDIGVAQQRDVVEFIDADQAVLSRPAIAAERLSLTPQGDVPFRLKTPYRNGTTHIVLEPLDFMARLAALVPPPRVHQTRYHGVLAPGSALRAAVTPSGRGASAKARAEEGGAPKAVRMTWMQRLRRVFAIEIETCQRCGGKLEVIASIEHAELIGRILEHREQRGQDDLSANPVRATGAAAATAPTSCFGASSATPTTEASVDRRRAERRPCVIRLPRQAGSKHFRR